MCCLPWRLHGVFLRSHPTHTRCTSGATEVYALLYMLRDGGFALITRTLAPWLGSNLLTGRKHAPHPDRRRRTICMDSLILGWILRCMSGGSGAGSVQIKVQTSCCFSVLFVKFLFLTVMYIYWLWGQQFFRILCNWAINLWITFIFWNISWIACVLLFVCFDITYRFSFGDTIGCNILESVIAVFDITLSD